jgi:uncharacterized glyoxalase superfamily protein PhnB
MTPPSRLVSVTPVLASRDIHRSIEFFCSRLGFTALHAEQGTYGVVSRDGVSIHFTACMEGRRADHSVIRIRVVGVDDLYDHCLESGIVDPDAPRQEQPWGSREFGVIDPDGNRITFAQWLEE